MKARTQPFWIWLSLCVAYSSYKLAQQAWGVVPALHGWFPDLLCLPILLGFVQFTIRVFKPQFSLSAVMVIAAFLYTSVLFEFYLPRVSEVYTADLTDVVCYALGALAFWIYQAIESWPLVWKRLSKSPQHS